MLKGPGDPREDQGCLAPKATDWAWATSSLGQRHFGMRSSGKDQDQSDSLVPRKSQPLIQASASSFLLFDNYFLPSPAQPPSAETPEHADEIDLVLAEFSRPKPRAGEIYGSWKCHPSPLPVNLPPHFRRLELFG